MKKLISIILLLSIMASSAFGSCNWATDITLLPDGNYEYTKGCHISVGQLVQDNKTKDAQIADLEKAIDLKSLAITNADARTQLWMTSANNENDRLQKMEGDQKQSAWLYFILGVATTGVAAYAGSQLVHH
jgi:hypothetical protein